MISLAATALARRGPKTRALVVHENPKSVAAEWVFEVAPGQMPHRSYHVIVVAAPVDRDWFESCVRVKLEPKGTVIFVSDGGEVWSGAMSGALGSAQGGDR